MKQDEIMMLTGKVSVCMSGPEPPPPSQTMRWGGGIVRYIGETSEENKISFNLIPLINIVLRS